MKFTPEELEQFETQSRENMVWFYQSELRKILKGQRTMGILPDNVRKRLREYGVIIKGFDGDTRGSVYHVTSLGKEIMRDIGR